MVNLTIWYAIYIIIIGKSSINVPFSIAMLRITGGFLVLHDQPRRIRNGGSNWQVIHLYIIHLYIRFIRLSQLGNVLKVLTLVFTTTCDSWYDPPRNRLRCGFVQKVVAYKKQATPKFDC